MAISYTSPSQPDFGNAENVKFEGSEYIIWYYLLGNQKKKKKEFPIDGLIILKLLGLVYQTSVFFSSA